MKSKVTGPGACGHSALESRATKTKKEREEFYCVVMKFYDLSVRNEDLATERGHLTF